MTDRARRESLVDRLTRTVILWVGAAWLCSALGVVWYVDREINLNFDAEMIESAHRMVDIAVHDYDLALAASTGGTLPLPLLGREPVIDDDPVVFQLVDADEHLLMRSREAPATNFPAAHRTGFGDTDVWRIYTVAHPTRPLYLHLADELSERRAHRYRTLLGLIVPMLAILPLLAWGLRRIARSELHVLQRLESQIAARGSADLSRIAVEDMPAELRSVGDHVNRLLERLGHALDTERALAANAAHELRTPLASVRLRLQTALDGALSQGDVQAALHGLADLSHRAEKLLQLSRAESAASLGRDSVDLVRVAALVVDTFWGTGPDARRIQLTIDERGVRPARGDADAIAIALRNLVENALRYAPVGEIEVRVAAPATLVVRDEGPGATPAVLEEMRGRHVRRAGDMAGYGLGLSIVGSIVERHGAAFELSSPRPDGRAGLEARLVFLPMPLPVVAPVPTPAAREHAPGRIDVSENGQRTGAAAG